MNVTQKLSNAKKATQFIFFTCGLGISSWAPMVPYVKDRLMLNEADLGFLLLLLGLGAIVMMPVSGILMNKIGSRKVIVISTFLVALAMPFLTIISTFTGMAIVLFIFGCGIGTVDVAMNAHGVQVQNLYGRPIMSSLHGLFSVGGLLGPLGIGFLMKSGLNPLYAAIAIALLLIILAVSQYKYLFDSDFEKETINQFTQATEEKSLNKSKFQWLNGSILLLGFMCFSTFLSEGAMLDWSAVFLRDLKDITPEFAGAGYAAFSIAMAVMRLLGDRIVSKLNSKTVVTGGGLIAVTGVILIIAGSLPVSILGFILLGAGAANIVPIFFSEGGKIPGVSPTTSISAITTMGYAGQLAGPALLGYIAHLFSLQIAFGLIAFLLLAVAVIYGLKKNK